jgi:spore maturation protein CgeB
VTLAKLQDGTADYISPGLIRAYQLYLTFTGGPTPVRIETYFGSPMARPLYCSVDPEHYYPEPVEKKWELGFLGTYSPDRQPALDRLLIRPAREWPEGRFVVAGAQYPPEIQWPANIDRFEHLPPEAHRRFYNEQVFTLNLTRAAMVRAGHSPSVRLFEAAACGVAIITDPWEGLSDFFEVGEEILVASSPEETLRILRTMSEEEARRIGGAGRERVLAAHTAAHRAAELERHLREANRARAEAAAGEVAGPKVRGS